MIESVKNIVSAGRLKLIQPTIQEALDGGASADEILDSMMAAMDEVGTKFQNNEIYVPEMLVAAKTMQRGVAAIKPLLAGDAVGKYGKYIIGTVSGMDTPLTPYQKGARSFSAYMSGITAARLQQERDEVIDATVESVRALAPAIRGALDQGYICVVGNENTIEENKELFDKVVSLS